MAKRKPALSALEAEVAAGRAVELFYPVRVIVPADGVPLYPGDDGVVYLDHARLRLEAGVPVVGDTPPKGFKSVLSKIRLGAGAILRLLDSPILAALVPGGTLGKVRRIAAVATLPPEAQLAAVIHEVGSDRLQEVWAAIEAARADGKVTAEEIAEILRIAKGAGK